MNNERMFEHLVRTTVSVRAWRFPVFQLYGYTGFLLAFALSFLLARYLGLSQLTLLGVTGTAILTFYALTMITKVMTGREVLIYYHHEIAVLAASALFLRLTRQAILPYLDVIVLGLGLFLAFGRIGCFMVGCCHGRPCRWGVRYGEDHAEAGFPRYLVGVKLFPIQGVESLLALSLVGCGLFWILKPHTPGSLLLLYIVGYGCARFCFEFVRGDADRRYFLGFSEAQWTSFLIALCVLGAAYANLLPRSPWQATATIAMVVFGIVVSVRRRFDRSRRFEFFHPAHVREISRALNLMHLPQQQPLGGPEKALKIIRLYQTSAGYQISGSLQASEPHTVAHISISGMRNVLSEKTVYLFKKVLAHLQEDSDCDLIRTNSGVFHLVFKRSEFTR